MSKKLEAVKPRRTYHTTRWPKEQGQKKTIYKTLHIKLKIEQHELR